MDSSTFCFLTFSSLYFLVGAISVSNPAEQMRKLSYLIGEWHGRGEGFDTGKDDDIANALTFAYGPSPSMITGHFSAKRSGRMENSGTMTILYDSSIGRFVRKQIYSYGFIMNEIGEMKGDRLTFDCVSIDAEPDYWKGLRIRSFLQRHSDNDFSTGLETAKEGEDFRLYGQNRFQKKQ